LSQRDSALTRTLTIRLDCGVWTNLVSNRVSSLSCMCQAAVSAVHPGVCVRRFLRPGTDGLVVNNSFLPFGHGTREVLVVGGGKAVVDMVEALVDVLKLCSSTGELHCSQKCMIYALIEQGLSVRVTVTKR
jgi:hypothetical protein